MGDESWLKNQLDKIDDKPTVYDPVTKRFSKLEGWEPIETAPRDTDIDTCGFFEPYPSDNSGIEKGMIRRASDYIGKTTVYPLRCTFYEHESALGVYTRMYWMHIPKLPTLTPKPQSEGE